MSYMAVKDLKKTRELREVLSRDREVIVTKDGKPFALMVEISPDAVEDSLDEVRRALFSAAVKQARKKAVELPMDDESIAAEILASRESRGL
ncbi:MAG: hypothetical protein GXY61_05410 [Lentisphaerae bacterium]|jgi:DNA-binding protein YbaB|nr:hypothetical protein [Lentisphaerota bacterium]